MIKYEGIKTTGQVSYIIFSNELNNIIEIPIATLEADRISMYLDKISTEHRKPVERGNDDNQS